MTDVDKLFATQLRRRRGEVQAIRMWVESLQATLPRNGSNVGPYGQQLMEDWNSALIMDHLNQGNSILSERDSRGLHGLLDKRMAQIDRDEEAYAKARRAPTKPTSPRKRKPAPRKGPRSPKGSPRVRLPFP